MPTVVELTALYANFMLGPRPGPSVCRVCFNFTDGYERCYACVNGEAWLDAVAPISYSVAREQLHHSLARYKRLTGEPARRAGVELAAVLWRYLAAHEQCVARAAHTDAFALVTTVPSSDRRRDASHPVRWIVGNLVWPTRLRHEQLLRRSAADVDARAFNPQKYEAVRPLAGQPVLLIDDTWTTGANAQSAAAALKSAGAGPVAAVVIGRHLNREWHENDRRLRRITRPFDWDRCALCGGDGRAVAPMLRSDASADGPLSATTMRRAPDASCPTRSPRSHGH
jgi:predicted amidophosphoribosyltransferase